jgi:hypothetical protein
LRDNAGLRHTLHGIFVHSTARMTWDCWAVPSAAPRDEWTSAFGTGILGSSRELEIRKCAYPGCAQQAKKAMRWMNADFFYNILMLSEGKKMSMRAKNDNYDRVTCTSREPRVSLAPFWSNRGTWR